MKYLKLFFSMLTLSAFTFGGGYVIVTLMKKRFVDRLHWLDDEEMLDITAIAQSSPGPVAVNAALLAGYRIAGVPGAAVSVIATLIPPLAILSVISLAYEAFRDNRIVSAVLRGMQSGVTAVIADVVTELGGKIVKNRNILSVAVMLLSFCAVWFFDINIVLVILVCGGIGAVNALVSSRRAKGAVK